MTDGPGVDWGLNLTPSTFVKEWFSFKDSTFTLQRNFFLLDKIIMTTV